MERKFNYPIFATQGGGLVREIKTSKGFKYIFVEAPPQGMGLDVGDDMPAEWDLIPANNLAREAVKDDDPFAEDDVDRLYDLAMREYTHRGPNARQL